MIPDATCPASIGPVCTCIPFSAGVRAERSPSFLVSCNESAYLRFREKTLEPNGETHPRSSVKPRISHSEIRLSVRFPSSIPCVNNPVDPRAHHVEPCECRNCLPTLLGIRHTHSRSNHARSEEKDTGSRIPGVEVPTANDGNANERGEGRIFMEAGLIGRVFSCDLRRLHDRGFRTLKMPTDPFRDEVRPNVADVPNPAPCNSEHPKRTVSNTGDLVHEKAVPSR